MEEWRSELDNEGFGDGQANQQPKRMKLEEEFDVNGFLGQGSQEFSMAMAVDAEGYGNANLMQDDNQFSIMDQPSIVVDAPPQELVPNAPPQADAMLHAYNPTSPAGSALSAHQMHDPLMNDHSPQASSMHDIPVSATPSHASAHPPSYNEQMSTGDAYHYGDAFNQDQHQQQQNQSQQRIQQPNPYPPLPIVHPSQAPSPASTFQPTPSHQAEPLSPPMVAHPAGVPKSICPRGEPSRQLSKQNISDLVREYLSNPSVANSVSIYCPRVTQKSYRSEKRWITPPPMMTIKGSGWPSTGMHVRVAFDEASSLSNDPSATAQFAGTGMVQQATVSKDVPGSFHKLYISDSKEDKPSANFALYFRVGLGSSLDIGVFQSSNLKLIPKPTKTTKDAGLYIMSGTRVSLFIRPRSQSLQNKYLMVDPSGTINVNSEAWCAFTITAVQGIAEGSVLTYGSEVVLQSESGVTTNSLILRRIDKNRVEPLKESENQFVSHLHHVALQLTGSDMYLVAEKGGLALQSLPQSDGDGPIVDHSSNWTIVGVDSVTYTFAQTPEAAFPYSPVPLVTGKTQYSSALIALHGKFFSPHLTVCFGQHPVPTKYKSQELLVCELPSVSQVCGVANIPDVPAYCAVRVEVPITLVRADGIIYPTSQTFSYTPQPLADVSAFEPAMGFFSSKMAPATNNNL